MPKKYGQSCPVARSLEFLGERWTLLIVRDLLMGAKKFQDFSASLGGVTPAVLSHRLKVLETHGIVSRRLYSEHPPRAEYALTERGLELRPVVRALGIWGARHLGASWTFVHETCGTDVEIAYYCPECDAAVTTDQVRRRPQATPAGRSTRRSRRSGSPRAAAARV
ncbi:MAG: winged helix-turn-helix transcriptional regulator [Vicinamibacterales bacterium]